QTTPAFPAPRPWPEPSPGMADCLPGRRAGLLPLRWLRFPTDRGLARGQPRAANRPEDPVECRSHGGPGLPRGGPLHPARISRRLVRSLTVVPRALSRVNDHRPLPVGAGLGHGHRLRLRRRLRLILALGAVLIALAYLGPMAIRARPRPGAYRPPAHAPK